MAYGVALLLIKKENDKEIEVRYTEELRMDYPLIPQLNS